MVNANRKRPASPTDLEDFELPAPRKCTKCGARFYGTGTEECLECRMRAAAEASGGTKRPPAELPIITIRTYP